MDNVLLWDENKVIKWITFIGFGAYEKQFKGELNLKKPMFKPWHVLEQGITGDVLIHLDHETLQDLTIHSVGQRLDILKHIYQLKTSCRIPINEWDYVPPSKCHKRK